MIVLASASPRRRDLLTLAAPDFWVVPAKGEENADPTLPPNEYVCELAKNKAEEVAVMFPDETVIGADTVVIFNGEILGKPKDEEDAQRMLRLLSGNTHSVFTGVAIVSNGQLTTFAEETRVTFFELDEREVARYVASGEPFDKAGAYGIQDAGALLVKGIEGDYYNVMGLPVGSLYRRLKDMKIV